MDRVILDCACGARLDATRLQPGKKVRCPKCGAGLTVPGPGQELPVLDAAVEESAPAAAGPATSPVEPSFRRRDRRPPPPPKKTPVVPIAIGAAVLVGVGVFVFARPSGAGPAKPPAAPAANVAVTPAATPAVRVPEDPRAAKRAEFQKKRAAAEGARDVAALVAAARFAEEGGFGAEALDVYRIVLGLDREQEDARTALGYAKYEGPAEEYRGKWLSKEQLAKARGIEAAIREEAERWTKDDFMRHAAQMKGRMESLSAPTKFEFFADTTRVPRPYLIAAQQADIPPAAEVARQVGPVFEALYKQFYEEYGEPCGIKPLPIPVPVWIFASREDYDKLHKSQPALAPRSSKDIGGYYLGAFAVLVDTGEGQDFRSSGYLYLWNNDALDAVAFHEGTHQLMDFNAQGRGFAFGQSPWFQEGVAEYWGGHVKKYEVGSDKPRYEIGRIQTGRYKGARDAFKSENEKERLSLKQLVEIGYPEFRRMQNAQEADKAKPEEALTISLVYAEGWALCHFLNKGLDGKYKKGFLQYVKAELEGDGGPEAFARCFGLKTDEDWNRLEEELKTHVLETLRREALDTDRRKPR